MLHGILTVIYDLLATELDVRVSHQVTNPCFIVVVVLMLLFCMLPMPIVNALSRFISFSFALFISFYFMLFSGYWPQGCGVDQISATPTPTPTPAWKNRLQLRLRPTSVSFFTCRRAMF